MKQSDNERQENQRDLNVEGQTGQQICRSMQGRSSNAGDNLSRQEAADGIKITAKYGDMPDAKNTDAIGHSGSRLCGSLLR